MLIQIAMTATYSVVFVLILVCITILFLPRKPHFLVLHLIANTATMIALGPTFILSLDQSPNTVLMHFLTFLIAMVPGWLISRTIIRLIEKNWSHFSQEKSPEEVEITYTADQEAAKIKSLKENLND